MTRPEARYVTVESGGYSIRTRYWHMGESGPTVILIHGLGVYIENWETTIPALAAHYRVYAMDLVGFGLTDKPKNAPYTPPFMARFVLDFMTALGLERAHVVGHSMGGGLALQFITDYPEKVDKLVLVNSAGLSDDIGLPFRILSIPVVGSLLSRPSRKGSAQAMKMLVHDHSIVTDSIIDWDYEMSRGPGAHRAAMKVIRAAVSPFGVRSSVFEPVSAKMGDIAAPTLVIWGEKDRVLPVTDAEIARQKIPNCRVEIFPDCGHVPQWEHPDQFNRLLMEFLQTS